MARYTYDSIAPHEEKPALGLIVLQSDETIESEFRHWFSPDQYDLFISRVPSGEEVSRETLGKMAEHLTYAASLFPVGRRFAAVGYACTSGTSVIGIEGVLERVLAGCNTAHVTNPLSALIDACRALGITRLAFLSPYVEAVSDGLREILRTHGIETPVFGSFEEAREQAVVRISAHSIERAALDLVDGAAVDGLFLSCTNLKTRGVRERLAEKTGLPVLSSNHVLAQAMLRHADTNNELFE